MYCPYLMDVPAFNNGFFLFKGVENSVVSNARISSRTIIECIKKRNEVEVAQDMLNNSVDQGSLICLEYAYFFSIPEPY